jgi:glycosyltransferase involved in cell wall biosynthesis
LISVIIPCYNQGAYIQEAIDSVKAQTYADWEIIIVNDGSDAEETLQQLVRLKEEGFQIMDIANSGVSAARNKGIAVAKGSFVLPLDADDKIAPRYLEESIKILEYKPEVK